MAYCPAADEGFANLLHFNTGHEAGVHTVALERALQGHGVDNGGEHTHVVALYAVYTERFGLAASEDVSSTDYNGNFNTMFFQFFDLFTILLQNVGVYIGIFLNCLAVLRH